MLDRVYRACAQVSDTSEVATPSELPREPRGLVEELFALGVVDPHPGAHVLFAIESPFTRFVVDIGAFGLFVAVH